jgi:hypothetical protein
MWKKELVLQNFISIGEKINNMFTTRLISNKNINKNL